jgi:protein-S-isoprenylcysteine O-methyltransferase Ste14
MFSPFSPAALRAAFYGTVAASLVGAWRGHSLAVTFAGGAVAALGLLLRAVARINLGREWRLGAQAGEELVARGLYRFVRHPAYLGMVLVGLGVVVAMESAAGLGVLVLGLLPALAFRISVEEAALFERFGEAYASYARRTKRFVPALF